MIHEVREASAEEVAARLPEVGISQIDVGLTGAQDDGALAFRREPFDSELFGLQVGRITGLTAPDRIGYENLLSALLDRASHSGYQQILRRTKIDALQENWALTRHGFELMDVGLVFGRPLTGAIEAPRFTDFEVRLATDADVEGIVGSMLDIPWGSRYEADPAYTPEQVRQLRTRWLWNSHRGRAAAFLVGIMDGRAAGYVTCLLDEPARHGEVELVGTLPAFRGRRVASQILAHAVAWFSTRASVVTGRTQATNYAAAALYEKSGFTLYASDVTYRRTLG